MRVAAYDDVNDAAVAALLPPTHHHKLYAVDPKCANLKVISDIFSGAGSDGRRVVSPTDDKRCGAVEEEMYRM